MGRTQIQSKFLRFRIGYGLATAVLDRMTATGILGPDDHNKPRKLL